MEWFLYDRVIRHERVKSLMHFMPLIFFYTPLKYQKTKGFLMFSGGIETDQWYEILKIQALILE